MKKVTVSLSAEEIQIVVAGLLELPAKFALNLISRFQGIIAEQQKEGESEEAAD